MKNLQALIVASVFIAVPAMAQSAESAAVATSIAAQAGTPLTVTADAMIVSADGHRVGRVDHVRFVNGAPVAASVIFAGRFVDIPVSSLTAKDRGFVTSLKTSDIMKR